MSYFKTETKTGGTKRRAHDIGVMLPYGSTGPSQLNRRVNRIAKQMKVHNPLHLYNVSLVSAFSSLSTTGTAFDLMAQIVQGDASSERFSSKAQLRRVNFGGMILAGTTATTPVLVRISIVRLQSGSAFASNLFTTYNPIQTGTSLQVYYDKYFEVAGNAGATCGWPTCFNVSKKIKHFQKYSGTGANNATGDSIFMIMQANATAGTGAPTVSGVLEVFFDPM